VLKARIIIFTLLVLVLVVMPTAAPAQAGSTGGSSPTVQHFVIDLGPLLDDIMTQACGFEVFSTVSIRGVDITFVGGQPSGLFFQSTFRNQVTFSANARSVVFNERGHESIRLQDGVVVDASSGRNFGLGTIGRFVFRFDPNTGELLSTTVTGLPVDLAPLCAALSS
jgi:hypothetical protein